MNDHAPEILAVAEHLIRAPIAALDKGKEYHFSATTYADTIAEAIAPLIARERAAVLREQAAQLRVEGKRYEAEGDLSQMHRAMMYANRLEVVAKTEEKKGARK